MSLVGVVQKRLNTLHNSPETLVSWCKRTLRNSYSAFFDRSRSLWLRSLTAKYLCPSATSSRLRWCAGREIRGFISNSGGSQNLMITVMVQFASTRLVVRKSVDNTHCIACSLLSLLQRCMYKTMQVAE